MIGGQQAELNPASLRWRCGDAEQHDVLSARLEFGALARGKADGIELDHPSLIAISDHIVYLCRFAYRAANTRNDHGLVTLIGDVAIGGGDFGTWRHTSHPSVFPQ